MNTHSSIVFALLVTCSHAFADTDKILEAKRKLDQAIKSAPRLTATQLERELEHQARFNKLWDAEQVRRKLAEQTRQLWQNKVEACSGWRNKCSNGTCVPYMHVYQCCLNNTCKSN